VTTPLPKGSGFSGNACGNPIRLRLKAPSGPSLGFTESVWSFEAVRSRAKQYCRTRPVARVGCEGFTGRRSTRPNPANLRFSGGPKPAQDHVTTVVPEGGAPDFPCRLKTAVPVR
jgi:hypothetical protein